MPVKPIPDGFHTVTPYMAVKGADDVIEFLKRAFEAEELSRVALPDGTVMNAEIKVGDSILMVAEAKSEYHMPASIYLYVRDTDETYQRAIRAGATSLMEPADQFYGDRNAGVVDSGGNHWWIATHVEDVSPEEIQKRAGTHSK
jgi:PhnB protein